MDKINNKKGFSLIELTMVLALASTISFMKFQDLKREQENIEAQAVGQQIKQIGEAVNGYINIRYDKLSTLTSISASAGTDPGPRTCSTATNSCTITYQTLVNEGLLPATFTGKDAKSNGYNIILKRAGISPNYIINGLITTNNTWAEGNKIRYDLLGKAMQAAGVDSGMSKTTSTMSGYSGAWTDQSTDYSNINKTGLLGYRVGYDSAMYSIYLRRDGTLPMTGDLNMGTKSINNAQNITASGKGTFGGEVEAGAWIHAKNGYGDVISLGGDASTNDYEIRLGSDKPLSIHGPSPVQVNISGSLRTAADLNADRNINAGNWLSAKNGLGNKVMIGGDTTGDYDVVFEPSSNGNNVVGFFSNSNTTFDFNFRGNVNTLNTAGTKMGVSMNGNTGDITASGNITSLKTITGQYLKASQIVSAGATCSENGLLARDNAGQVLSCISGIWQPEQPVGSPIAWPSTTPPSGWLICNGQAFNKAQYPLLAKAYPSGVLPDLRGSFIRGLDQGRGIDNGRTILTEQRASVVTGTDDNWAENDVGVLHGPSSWYSRDSINIYDYTTGNNGQDPKYWVHFGNGQGPAQGESQGLAGDIRLNNNGSNGFYGGARPYNTAFVYIVRAM